MLIGVVSDTHNNKKNIEKIIDIFNSTKVELVIHTGDVSNSKSLEYFSSLNCPLYVVLGNNDRNEKGLKEVAEKNNFLLNDQPLSLEFYKKKIVVFHEPDGIQEYLTENSETDLVFHGHTHRYREEKKNNTTIFNPGESAGMIKGANSIGTVDLKNMLIKRIFF
jgi:putative phosphoesterase